MKRFDIGGAILAVTPVVYMMFNSSDNPTYYNKDGSEYTQDAFLSGLTVTAYGAFKFELGLCDATTRANFTPYYTTYATLSTSGGLVKSFMEGQPDIPFSTTRVAACRITVYSDATVFAAGDFDIRTR